MSRIEIPPFYRLLLLGILVVSAFVRLWYISYAGGGIDLKPDSQGYYVEENFFGKNVRTNFFNPNRTPGYTMITSLAMAVTGDTYPLYGTREFTQRLWIIIVIQTIASVLSLIFLFDTLIRLNISPPYSLAFTAFTGLNLYQFIWDRTLLTESLYISLLIVLLWLFVRLLHRVTTVSALLFTGLAAYAFMLRPAGLLLPFLTLPLVWVMHRTKRVFTLIAFCLLLYTLIPATFLTANRILHNFRGISYNTDFSVFGRILLYDIPVDAAASVLPLHAQVVEYKQNGGNVSIPWYFFVHYNNEIYDRVADLQRFNALVVRDQFGAFMRSVVADIPKAFFDTEVYGVIYRASAWSPTRAFFDVLDGMIQVIQKSTIMYLLLAPLTVWLFLKKQTPLHTFLLSIVLIEGYQLFSSLVFGGAWEFARHIITTQTFLFFLCFWWIAKAIGYVYNRR